MIDPVHAAIGRFARGYNCCQSIFSAFVPPLGISDDLALRLASPFGGGVARQGQVCGALTGALMVLGLQYGSKRPENKEEIYRRSQAFISAFQQRHGSILCRELIGIDTSTPEGLQAAREKNVFATVCPALVEATARALAADLKEQ